MQVAATARQFERDGYLIVPRLVNAARAAKLCAFQRKLDALGWHQGDRMVPGAFARYGTLQGEQLLLDLCAKVAAITGVALAPTYSYLRIYHAGDVLHRHHDRAACEVSVSITLGHDCVRPWPLWIAGRRARRPVQLSPGDGVVYRGIECEHWRTRFRGRWQCQLFLHYVDRHGPYALWQHDLRRGPSSSSGKRHRSARSPLRATSTT